MGSINKSHNEADGGVLLFGGELILIYCDAVTGEIGSKESVKGRIYLTTHRIIFVATPMKPNLTVKSFCAPFFALTDISLEQPVFGANYIKARVKDENDSSQSFTFKLKFFKGGAIEFARAMDQAASTVSRMFNPNQPPPAYTPTPEANQYYQAPPNVYAPGYNCGFQMPTQQFPDQPPIGFIYATSAPPPYPGMTQPPPPTTLPSSVPSYPQGPTYNQAGQYGYPGQAAGGPYPDQQPPPYGYPNQHAPPTGYPTGGLQQPDYNQQQPAGGYPGQAPPSAQASYPGPPAGQPNQSGSDISQPMYPNLNPQSNAASAPQSWPSAPSYNPGWEEEKKSK